MTTPTINKVEVEGDAPALESSESTTFTKQLPREVIGAAISDVVGRGDEQYALELVTMLQVKARIVGDTGERLSFAEFASEVGIDLEQLRAE